MRDQFRAEFPDNRLLYLVNTPETGDFTRIERHELVLWLSSPVLDWQPAFGRFPVTHR